MSSQNSALTQSTRLHKKGSLPDIPWTANNNKLILLLLGEMEKRENAKVLYAHTSVPRIATPSTFVAHCSPSEPSKTIYSFSCIWMLFLAISNAASFIWGEPISTMRWILSCFSLSS